MKAKSAAPVSAFKDALGAQPPLGFFDPLGLLADADQARFDRLRYVEVKHGRISMLAVLGHIVTASGVRLPGDVAPGVKFADCSAGLASIAGPHSVPFESLIQTFLFIGISDIAFTNIAQPIVEAGCEERMNGLKWSDSVKDSKRAIELNNGRAAQMGILALMVHEKLDNNPYIINSLLGAPVAFN